MIKIIKFIIFVFLIFGFSSVGFSEEKWNEFKSVHFIIFYKDAPLDFVETVNESAEEYYGEIADNLGFTRYEGWTWDDRAKIYIYDDDKDYIESSKNAQWSHGVASPEDKIIRTFPTAHGFFDSTLPHELGHIVFREFIGFRARVPRWFEEGVAMYQEKAKRWGSNRLVQNAIEEEKFISLSELTSMRLYNDTEKEVVSLYYMESASVVYFMINELGQSRFVRFCRHIKDEGDFERALREVYIRYKSIEDLNKAWLEYLEQ